MPAPTSATRVFARYAFVSLLPVVALGLALDYQVRKQIDDRALAEAVSRAQTIADANVDPIMGPGVAAARVTPTQRALLVHLTNSLHGDASVLRLRIRSTTGSILFDSTHPQAPAHGLRDGEVIEAAGGTPVASLTTLGADAVDGGTHTGTAAVETYVAFHGTDQVKASGVLETYLPYASFGAAAAAAKQRVTQVLIMGLLTLWGLLALVSWSLAGHLRRSARTNDWLARHDRRTSLPNRLWFAERAAALLDDADEVALSIADIARFREVNDTLGHALADEYLGLVAARIRGPCRKTPRWRSSAGTSSASSSPTGRGAR